MKVDVNYYKNLGKRLAHIREEKNLSQRKVAEALGVTFQQYQKYESGVNRIPANSLVVFCDLTNSDLREVAGITISDYEKAYKESVVKNIYNTTYVNNFNGLFSNLFNMDLRLMKNKIAVAAVIIAIIVFSFFQILKFFPSVNSVYNHVFISLQLTLFIAVLAIIMFVVFSYSWLTYIITMFAWLGVVMTIDRFVKPFDLQFTNFTNLHRLVYYAIAIVLTFLTFFILKKLRINLRENQSKDTHRF